VAFASTISPETQNLLCDPQTSGGLLVALAPDQIEPARQSLAAAACGAMLIGAVLPRTSPLIAVE
jgi:selenide,water dikinase